MTGTLAADRQQRPVPIDKPILVVEDDPDTIRLVRLYLEREGHSVIEARDGIEGLRLARIAEPRLVVLDVMLPKMDGVEVCRELRAESDVPIIMLTARVDESDRLTGLDSGADDYVSKPFSPRELAARVRAVLRRASREPEEDRSGVLRFADIELDPVKGMVTVSGRAIRFTATEFKLLSYMMTNAGTILSREAIIRHVFGYDFEGLDRTVDTHVSNLRRKLTPSMDDPQYIHTIYGMGYRFGDA